MILNADDLDERIVNETLNIILKHQGDIHKAQTELTALLQRKASEAQAGQPAAPKPAAAAVKKSVLH